MLSVRLLFGIVSVTFLFVGWLSEQQRVQAAETIEYRFRLLDGPSIEVSVQFRGNAKGVTTLQVESEWGGIQNDGRDIADLVIVDSNNRSLVWKSLTPTQWTVSHQPNEQLFAKYVIQPPVDRPYHPGNDYRTHLGEGWFQMIGHLGLLSPQLADEHSTVDIAIQWIGFREAGWQVACSFGLNDSTMHYEGPWSDFVHSMWMAGKVQVVERTVAGKSIGVAIAGNNWKFSPEEFANVIEPIIAAERNFFSDHSDPWYLVTLSPVSPTRPGGYSMGGTGLYNCFSLYCDSSLALQTSDTQENRDGPLRTLVLLAHEYFHHWNGGKIPTAGELPETYWFSEGFTNFYARRILLRANLISAKQYLDDTNDSLTKWAENPNKDAPNSRIVQGFWTDRTLQQLPYQRGDQIAIWLDELIREKTNGKDSLDSLMLELFRNPPKKPVTNAMLFERMRTWLDAEQYERLRSIVNEGSNVPIPNRLTEPSATLAKGYLQSFDSGFDMNGSQQSGKISGVNPDGPAFAAGLRNGQSIRSMNITSSPTPKATLSVIDNGVPKDIDYLPLSQPKEVSTYRLKSDNK